MRRARQKTAGSGIAFLDIMACGLGAVILIFMIVKYQTDIVETDGVDTRSSTLSDKLLELQRLQSRSDQERTELESKRQKLRQALIEKEASASIQDSQHRARAQEVVRLKAEATTLEKTISEAIAEQAKPVSSTQPSTQKSQHHLLGIEVKGPRILILLDSSASMAASHLIDIVKIQVSDESAKRSAPKWRRAVAAVRWLVGRVPENSRFMIVHYNLEADFVHGNQWIDPSDSGKSESALANVEGLYPDNATNLDNALQLVLQKNLQPSDIYIVTDGLPTKGKFRKSNATTGCLSYSYTSPTISSACRRALFYSAVLPFSQTVPATVNVVLLPVEGDPEAVYAYWNWSSATGGTVVSPPSSWP